MCMSVSIVNLNVLNILRPFIIAPYILALLFFLQFGTLDLVLRPSATSIALRSQNLQDHRAQKNLLLYE